MSSRSILRPRAAWLLAVLALASCRGAEEVLPFPVTDSGWWVSREGKQTIYWPDDDRVLFVGTHDGAPPNPRAEYGSRGALVIWRSGDEPTVYRRRVVSACYRPGRLWYKRVEPGNRKTFFAGPMGEESRVEPKLGLDPINCRTLEETPGEREGRRWFLMREEHGYIDVGARSYQLAAESAVFYPANGDPPVELPLAGRETSRPEYYAFKNAYLIVPKFYDPELGHIRWNWPGDRPQPLYWLTPDGEITRDAIPSGFWNRGGGLDLVATRAGYVVVYHAGARSAEDPGFQGVYLIRDDEVVKVLSGYATMPAVSPDGCRLAVAHAPNIAADLGTGSRRSAKVIEFCN